MSIRDKYLSQKFNKSQIKILTTMTINVNLNFEMINNRMEQALAAFHFIPFSDSKKKQQKTKKKH